MNRWASEHPEEYAEIVALPLSQQNEAMRAAVGWDPDRLREEQEEQDRRVTDHEKTIALNDRTAEQASVIPESIGMEATPQNYLARMEQLVTVAREETSAAYLKSAADAFDCGAIDDALGHVLSLVKGAEARMRMKAER